MFSNVLIANRGEIAYRALRSLRESYIPCTVIYSNPDKDAPYIDKANQKICIGSEEARHSYLNIAKILEAARDSKADAVYPGCGMLAESPQFAKAVVDEKLTWIGPNPRAMAVVADKLEMRAQLKGAGIAVPPGVDEPLRSAFDARAQADKLGYPVMLKPANGRDGIGLIKIERPDHLEAAFERCKNAAQSRFGSSQIYLEKFIENARLVEVPVVCDLEGKALHLYERECSVQRRFQKVIEESPSPGLDPRLAKKLHALAVRAAEAVHLTNVGVVEFLIDDKNAYCLEITPHPGAAHPVTELTTGVDLVALQVRIAAHEEIFIEQNHVPRTGHAIQCRIYAEDTATGYPAAGALSKYVEAFGDDIRVDSGVQKDNVVTVHYDPLLAKVAAWGPTREHALQRMMSALNMFEIEGVKTNLALLKDMVAHPDFVAGSYRLGFPGGGLRTGGTVKLEISKAPLPAAVKPPRAGATLLTTRKKLEDRGLVIPPPPRKTT